MERTTTALRTPPRIVAVLILFMLGTLVSLAQPPIGLEALQSVEQWPLNRPGIQFRQVSSADPLGGDQDGNGFLYQQDSLFVIFNQEGPGCIYRLWIQSTTTSPSRTIKFFFDYEPLPRISLPIQQLFSGLYYPFVSPIVGNAAESSGGFYCYLPITFAKHLKIAIIGHREPYQIGFHLFASGTIITTYNGQEDPTTVQNQWQSTGSDPKNQIGNLTATGSVNLPPGSTRSLFTHSGAGSIAGIRLTPDQTVLSVLESLKLRCYWDGSLNPEVDCSLGSFFGSSLGIAEVAGLPIGIDGNEFYCYIPMPFWSAARIEIYNSSPISTINVGYTITYKTDAYSQDNGYFCAKQQNYVSSIPNQDILLPQFAGHGNLIGMTLTLLSTNQQFTSGDLRIYLDGIAQPVALGTNLDADFNAGNGYTTGPFSKPMHGAPVILFGLERKVTAYRFMLGDLIPFASHITIRAEHGDRNSVPVQYSAVAYSFCRPGIALELSDQLDVGDPTAEAAHNYNIQGGQTAQTHYYAYPGSYDDQFFSDAGRTHVGISTFDASISADNEGVRLVRRRDASLFPQSAEVRVNGDSVGVWWDSDYNYYKRWSDSYYEIPPVFTQGLSQIEVSLTHLGVREWSEYYFWIYSHVPPRVDTDPPTQVSNLQILPLESGSQLQASWNPSTDDSGINHYNIYRSTIANFQPSPDLLISTSITPEFTDNNLSPGTYYYYRVSAADYSGNVSAISAEGNQRTSCNYLFEAENFTDLTTSPDDPYGVQNMIGYGEFWSNQSQLIFAADQIGDFITCRFQITQSDTYDVSGYFTRAPNCGILSFRLDDVPMALPYDLYNPLIQRSPQQNFGSAYLVAGMHTCTYFVAGKNAASSEYFLGIDNLILTSHYLLPVEPQAPPGLPLDFSLSQNFPNPFNSTTRIQFSLPKSGIAKLTIYDLQGRQVAVLAKGWSAAGRHEVLWQADNFGSGIYFLRLEQDKKAQIRKILMLK
ncbi:MAG: DUF2961 domain-containing protein [bacterium]|nr:DUF2961 domain-containing protein [bacterium]